MPTFLARPRVIELPDGSRMISLDLIRDQDAVELADGDKFYTVQMAVDPFEDS